MLKPIMKLQSNQYKKMKKYLIKTAILFPMFLLAIATMGQVKSQNNNIWLHYVGKYMLTPKLSFTMEATMRYTDMGGQKQQWFIRPSMDYQVTKKVVASLGYTHYVTYPYGNPAMFKIQIPEDHLWLQGTYAHTAGKLKISHRLRDENRWVGIAVAKNGIYSVDHYQYRNRLRYMFMLNYPLTMKGTETKLFALFGDEVFLNIGTQSGTTMLNQNRIIGGLGYNFNSHHQIQLSYIHQNIWNYTNTIMENNPTLRISYINKFNLFKTK